jgi:hypothetical protein
MEIKGQIKAIMPMKSTANFRSIEVIITTDFEGNYPQHLSCQLSQGKTSLIDEIKVGDLVSAEINLKGREWTNPATLEVKYFNSIDIWSLKVNKPVF